MLRFNTIMMVIIVIDSLILCTVTRYCLNIFDDPKVCFETYFEIFVSSVTSFKSTPLEIFSIVLLSSASG